jgi:hypothetical protein
MAYKFFEVSIPLLKEWSGVSRSGKNWGGGRFFGNFLKTFMKICWKNYDNFLKILEKLSRFSKNS